MYNILVISLKDKSLMYRLVNQIILALINVPLIAMVFYCGHPSRFDLLLFLRSN